MVLQASNCMAENETILCNKMSQLMHKRHIFRNKVICFCCNKISQLLSSSCACQNEDETILCNKMSQFLARRHASTCPAMYRHASTPTTIKRHVSTCVDTDNNDRRTPKQLRRKITIGQTLANRHASTCPAMTRSKQCNQVVVVVAASGGK